MKNVNRAIILLATVFIGFSSIVYIQAKAEGEDTDKDRVYVTVEQMPTFPGGDAEMHKFIYENLKCPIIPEEAGMSGRATVRFIVTKTGEIKDVKAVRDPDSALTKSLVEVVGKMPLWIPGKQNGKEVDVYFTLPLNIHLRSK